MLCLGCLFSGHFNNLKLCVTAVNHTALTNLRVEEDLRAQEALVAHVDGELLLADGVDAGVLFDPLGAVRVVLAELFD